jgi:23S rRNA (cytosine1962-C5)-methyltransferase
VSERSLGDLLVEAIEFRRSLIDKRHEGALRLFNGFSEGCPDIAIDLYGETAVIHNYAEPPARGAGQVPMVMEVLRERLPWVGTIIVKTRGGETNEERRGIRAFGTDQTRKVKEHGIWYSIDLTMHQDCSFYLDTRALRRWAIERLGDKRVLNAFAYTGSLGVAALGGGAKRVVQLDRSRRFLDVARSSYALNGYTARDKDFAQTDFFRAAGGFRRGKERFDCVFLDPPFFATSAAGRVDQEGQGARLINKVRPLLAPGGILVAVNNALYFSGEAYMKVLNSVCSDGHLELSEIIPVPQDLTGFAQTLRSPPVTDPAPFNHSTKIAILRSLK